MKKTQGVLKTFPGDNFEIIPTYNEKQVTIGLLVKVDRTKKTTKFEDFEIIKPVLINVGSFLGCYTDALTGQKYNAFVYKFSDVDEPYVQINRLTTDLSKGLLDLPEDMGVIDYTGYYRMELFNNVINYLREQGLQESPENVYRTASKLKIEKIKSLILEQQVKDKGESRKKTEEK